MRRGRIAAVLLAAGLFLLTGWVTSGSASAASTCASWAGEPNVSLQSAINANSCVTVQPGTWHLTNHLVLPAGHTLTGVAGKASSTILYADASSAWGCCTGMIDVNPKNSDTTANASIQYLTLKAARRAVIGIGGGLFSTYHVRVLNTVCNGLSVYGPRVRVDASTFTGNGYGPTCPNAPPGAAIYVHVVPGDPVGGPVVTNSTFTGNGTPIDVDSVDGGQVSTSTFSGNDGWAGVALYRASSWAISRNSIQQPTTGSLGDNPGGNWSYQTGCQFGPSGGHPAAVWVCLNYDSDGHRADQNKINGNSLSSYYGILLMGLDDAAESGSPQLAPSANLLKNNRVTSAVVPAADDHEAGGPTPDNVWTGNTCAGLPCPVTYF